jgi:hypothetical protein
MGCHSAQPSLALASQIVVHAPPHVSFWLFPTTQSMDTTQPWALSPHPEFHAERQSQLELQIQAWAGPWQAQPLL